MADKTLTTEITFGTYYVRPGCEEQFEATIPRSWSTLRALGFIADELPTLYKSVKQPPVYLEVVRWLPEVMDPAHEHPDVIPVWTTLAKLVEPRTPETADRGLTFSEFTPVRITSVA
jgi:hypothetical protein